MATNAQRVVVAVDGSKIGKVTLAKMVALSQIDHLVTDSTADEQQLDRIAAAGVHVHVVDVGVDVGVERGGEAEAETDIELAGQ